MDWSNLMSRARISSEAKAFVPPAGDGQGAGDDSRTAFERDRGRILFCNAFRRMHDKTQVFPLTRMDVAHSRLTHCLEVSSVGRSLGARIGQHICSSRSAEHLSFEPHEVADVVEAACLAHDIGNPPFGHTGEDAISSFFRRTNIAKNRLNDEEWADLSKFEGNAQGFRLLTRIQLESDKGMHLTAATLASFTKYPRGTSTPADATYIGFKKHGVMQSEMSILAATFAEVGISSISLHGEPPYWPRHPLSFIVEASDDICYAILDLEDAVKLQIVSPIDAQSSLSAIIGKNRIDGSRIHDDDPVGTIGYFRALAISSLVGEIVSEFTKSEAKILAGEYRMPIVNAIPASEALGQVRSLVSSNCYSHASVLGVELLGYKALGGLLRSYVTALVADFDGTASSEQGKVLALLAPQCRRLREGSLYQRILRVLDYVSGMTDAYALATYRRFEGIVLPI